MENQKIARYILLAFVLLHLNYASSRIEDRKSYSMYVWDNGFDLYIDGCNEDAFLHPDDHPECYSHNWNTPEKREYLWQSCNVPGREISSIFLSGIPGLKYAKQNDDCDTYDIKMVRKTIRDGHSEVILIFRYTVCF